ncbi:TetR/AcrR family transcriptional regulator [Nocardia inohanensis]|uniref:TetR/AcrR family transcriptional regulator n=1 Tax=Nocardia inohanensis TaxID=209246 RepID=UPI000834BEE4|nr:TetR/AcrR family transcriptional regulator [Nocardia inohanensis]
MTVDETSSGEVTTPPKRRRAATRQRLLDAAFDAFAEDGLGRCTVEQLCERAGFTRGAFYSNFKSLEELFLAMWEQRSSQMLTQVTALLEVDIAVSDPAQAVEFALHAVPMDDKWFRITSEFTAHALRNPDLRQVMVAREEAISGALTPVVVALLARAGRHVPDPVSLGRSLIAVHDGTLTQCLLEPANEAVRAHRTDLFRRVVESYSEPLPSPENPPQPADSASPQPT